MSDEDSPNAHRARELLFERLSDQYGRDARADFRRFAALALVASAVIVAGSTSGAAAIVSSDHGTGTGFAIAGMAMITAVPMWWQADRCRRSALESRRLQRHSAAFEPYLAGFQEDARTIMRAALAPRLFSRIVEDDDPLREPAWPTNEELVRGESWSDDEMTEPLSVRFLRRLRLKSSSTD